MSLQVKGVHLQFPSFELEADFEVGEGSRAVLMGPSGSGKTTLFRILAGLEPVDSGQILLGGRDISKEPPERREIGVVFQDHALFPMLNVVENATFGLKMRGVSKKEAEQQALSWLERVGLGSRLKSSIDLLSGGEKSRVAFVRAILPKPKLLLFDEPFSALDVALRKSLRDALLELHRAHPVPLLLVTHDEEDARALATQRLVLNVLDEGRKRRVDPA